MPTLHRWLVAWLLGLALLPGLEWSLLSHSHVGSGPELTVDAAAPAATVGRLEHCGACQARASLGALEIDAHPERHGAAPAEPVPVSPPRAPCAPRLETPHVRGPPSPIV